MNRRILLYLLAIAVIPVVGLGMIPDDADRIGKQFAADYPGVTIGVHSLEEDISEKEEINRASLIVEGTVLEAKPFWKIVHENSNPRIFTDYTIQVDDVIKGQDKRTVKVTMSGGSLDGIKSQTAAPELAEGDRVIMILGQDLASVFGDSYTPVSISKSTYVIDENDRAKNHMDDRTDDLEKVKSRIAKLATS